MKVQQISIFIENKSGRLAEVARVLGEKNVNIRALSLADTSDFGILRLLGEPWPRAWLAGVVLGQPNGFGLLEPMARAAELAHAAGALLVAVVEPVSLAVLAPPCDYGADIAAGEGRNTVWLAELGWDATAVDYSAVAIDKARQIAERRGVVTPEFAPRRSPLRRLGRVLVPLAAVLVVEDRRFFEHGGIDPIGIGRALFKLIQTGEIAGFTHLYAGQEAVAVGVCEHLSDDDYIVSTHRGHGHLIAKGGELDKMMAELYGRETGYCRGRGGSS